MYEVIVFVILSILSFVIAKGFKKLDTGEFEFHYDKGTITGVVRDNGGSKRYWISFFINGELYEGVTFFYSATSKKFEEGNVVPIKYYFTKAGKLMVEISDAEMKDGSAIFKHMILGLKIASLVFAIIAVFFMMKNGIL